MDFAKLAAAQLVPVVHVLVEKRTTYKSFKKGGFWLAKLGQDVLPVFKTVDENAAVPLNDNAFFTGLSLSVLADLTATHGTKSSFATVCSTISRSVSSDHRSPPTA